MKATELMSSIQLMIDYGLVNEARRLLNKMRRQHPHLLGENAWEKLSKLTARGGRGLPVGYRYDKERCPVCDKHYATNWMLRHLKLAHSEE
jgi:hypothetical protein